MGWLNELVNQHSELEAPQSFYYWSALTALSAVVKDQIWLPRQIYNLYPNIYTMLHADSGMKKGPPVAMAKNLVKQVNNTRIISGRSSIQGILKDLGQAQTKPGGKIVNKSVAFICSSELSSSIVEDKVATKILTDLYDRNYNEGEWRSLLKMETFTLRDPTISMLTATNESMAEDFFTRSAISGGYFARTFIVYEKEENRSNSLLVPLINPPNYVSSAEYLKEVAKLTGPFELLGSRSKMEPWILERKNRSTDEIEYFTPAGLIYEEWYDEFKTNIKKLEVKDETGTLNRFGDSVLKVAMLLSLARESNLIISEGAMSEAIVECEKLLSNVRRTTLGKQGLSTSAALKTAILTELVNREPHTITRQVLMKKMIMHFGPSEEFDNIMQSLDQSTMVVTQSVGNTILYTMPEKHVESMIYMREGKKK